MAELRANQPIAASKKQLVIEAVLMEIQYMPPSSTKPGNEEVREM
jgi:hypothetical protein